MAGLLVWPQHVKGQCIDFYDLDADYVTCEIGPYAARTGGANWTVQKVDFGPDGRWSRHTVHRSSTEIDTVSTLNGTVAGLHTVPSGEAASVRLGNKMDGLDVACYVNDCRHVNDYTGEAERITYTFTVTDESKYLLMRYAIIWENPTGHNDLLPSFQVETLTGTSGETVVNDLCYSFDMTVGSAELDYSGSTTFIHRVCSGYNGSTLSTETHPVAWRDWRTRVINLEPYIGQTIRLRITSSDCGHRGHFGYSYFTLRCLDANLYSPTCGGPTEYRTFTAPEGLNYIWYKVDDDHSTASRVLLSGEESNTLTVLNDGQAYECYIASPENANCHISLYAKAEPQLPLASFTIDKHEACVDTIFLIDESGISRDGQMVNNPHEDVDVVLWDLGDGRTNVVYTPGTPITYANDGTYTIRQTAKLTNGNCVDDSIQTVTVRGRLTKHESHMYDTICSGKIYTWYDSQYTLDGVYTHVLEHAAGGGFCDSTIYLHLKVWDRFYDSDEQHVLEGKNVPYHWHHNGAERDLYTDGVYWDSCVNVHGCDSVYRLELYVHPRYFIDKYDTTCCGTDFSFGKKVYNFSAPKDTICYDSLKTKTWGNDSVYCLHLHVKPTYHFYDTEHFCKGSSFTYHGQSFTEGGVHDVRFTTKQGCDSIFTLTLIENPTRYTVIDSVITDKQKPFIWHGINCANSGSYFDTLETVNGCDSVVCLRLTIYPIFFQEDAPFTLCKDSTIKWHTKYIKGITVGDTVVWDSLKNVYGYDSIYKAVMTVLPSYRVNITEQRAIGETYYFFGQPITSGGVYVYNGTTDKGCDSIVRLTITFLPKHLIKDTAYICAGQSYKYHKNKSDIYYDADGIYWDSLKTVAGYDSVYQLRLYVNPVYTMNKSATICEPATYDFFGETLTSSGVYSKTLQTHGRGDCDCDSTIVLNLTVNPKFDILIRDTICEGDSYMFEGETRDSSGYYVSPTYSSVDGCDSINRLQLTVIPKKRVHHNISLCQGESWHWYKTGEDINSNREVSDTLLSSANCDSINIWHISVHPVVNDTVYASVCQGATYHFHGYPYTLTEPGIDTITLSTLSSHNCDSTHVLILTVNPTYYEQEKSFSLCLGDYVTFNSRNYYRGGIYYDTLKTKGCGCDSAFIITIEEHPRYFNTSTISLCKDSSLIWHNKTIIRQGTYYDSLKSTLSNGVCDSIYELIVTEQQPALESITATILSTQSYSFNGKPLTEKGVYCDTLKAVGSACDSIVTLVLTVLPVYTVDTTIAICRKDLPYHFNGKLLEKDSLYTERFLSAYNTDSIVNLRLIVREPVVRDVVVHISDQELPYSWERPSNNEILEFTRGTEYSDTMLSVVTGCDSINRLKLSVHPTYAYYDTASICAGQSYAWHGNTYREANDYVAAYQTSIWEYDSIHYLHLVVNPVYRKDTTFALCTGETKIFGNKVFTAGVNDSVRFFTADCYCDSIYYVHANEYAPFMHTENMILCKDSTATWRGKALVANVDSIYYDSLTSKLPGKCDSIYALHVSIRQPAHSYLDVSILSTTSYWFNGHQCDTTGTYYDTVPAINSTCDSIIELHLTVLPVYTIHLRDTVCRRELPYQFNTKDIETGGLHTDTLISALGTDSIVNLLLVVYEPRIGTQNVHISDKQTPYEWTKASGEIVYLTIGGIYDDTIQNGSRVTGCDSITRLQLSIHPTYAIYDTASFCKGKSYTWQGNTYREPNDYVASYKTQTWNCDSIHYLHLTENPTYAKEVSFMLCTGDEVYFNNKPYTTGRTYYDTLKTTCCGCDSTYTIKINEYSPFFRMETMALCKDSVSEWHHKEIKATKDTIYYDSLKSVRSGGECDSIHALHVIVKEPEYTRLRETILSSSSYYFNGKWLDTTGVYYATLPAVNNTCDSIVELNLTVLPIYNIFIRDTICQRDLPYHFNNKDLENGGLHRDTLLSEVYGTDSIVNLTLVVFDPRLEVRNKHISDKETYTWTKHDGSTDILRYSGIYDDTLTSVITGCDSISRLQLFVHQTYNFPEEGIICDGKSYTWRGNQYKVAGDYYDSLKTDAWHVDSIYHLHLIVNDTSRHDTTVYLCAGDYYKFNNRSINTAGYHYDTLKTTCCDCDSTFRVHIIIRPTQTIPDVAYICPGDTFTWRGQDYTLRGEYTDTLRTKDGLCDSIYYTLSLKHKARYERDLRPEAICEGDYYEFQGRYINEPGDYDTTLVASNGCDSVLHLHIDVNPVYDLDIYDTICEGQSVLFADIDRRTSGQYVYTGKTKAGCDSIVTLHLTVIAKQTAYIEKHLCEGDYFEIDGQEIIRSGTYTEQSISKRGCDSTTIWRITIHKPLRDIKRQSICEGQEFMFHDVIYREPNTYIHEDQSRYGCDSTYILILTVNPVYRKDESITLCEDEYYTYNGHIYDSGGSFQDTAKTKNGCNCDSILNLTITKYPVTIKPEKKAICRGDSYTWRNMVLSRPGIYDDTIKMKNRLCDSVIHRLTLIVNNDYYEETTTTICDNGSILWRGHTYTQEDTYYDSLATSTGCDSVYCLKLAVKPTYRFDESVNRCDIEPYWYNGQWLTQTGDYSIRYGTKCCECDSVYVLHLRVTPTKRDTVRVNLCEGETYTYFGQPITQTGLYYDTINQPDIQQCIVSMMDIGFQKPTVISNVMVDEICADDSVFRMRTYYSGTRPQVYSLIFDDRARAEGFRSTINEPFDDEIYGIIPQKENGDYVRPDYYSARLIMDNDICASAGTASYDIQFLVRYPSWIIEQNWNDAVSLLNENYNGGYVFSKYAWYVNGNRLSADGSYIYLPQVLRLGDEVVVAPTRQGENYEVPSCPIVIYDKTPELIGDFPVEVTQTNVRGRFLIRAKVEGEYLLYSATGCLIAKGTYHKGEQVLNTQLTTGCYLLHLITNQHGTKTLKLISQ